MMDYPINMQQRPDVQGFFDAASNTITYLVTDPATRACAIIDSVMELDYAAGQLSTASADKLIDAITAQGLTLEWIIETHVHADHLSAAPYLQEKLGGKIGVGARIVEIQQVFGKIFNEGTDIAWETTVAEEKAHNIHVGGGKTREEFIAFRTKRDAELGMPKLIIPSLQVNMRGGEIPRDDGGNAVLKVPLNALKD